ncbi:hypothetical protein BJY01DRAFT_250258 [Aspergillus pseudoustus]|uniref:RING-type domain-containing protein n=1 Tax=Aspergillus pseudoustus TaxID=1810923 RepID=A0ABR4JIP4_9EURO
MNSDFQQPTMQDSGFQTSALPNAGHYIDYTQPFDSLGQLYDFPSPNINEQGYSLPQFGVNHLVSSPADMTSTAGYSTAQIAMSQSLGNRTNATDNGSLSSFANLDGLTTLPPQLSNLARTTQPSFDTSSYLTQLPPTLQSIPLPYIAPYPPSFSAQLSNSPQRSTQPPAPNAQPRMSLEPSTTIHTANLSQGPSASLFSVLGSSSGSNQQRRHQRTSSVASPPHHHISRHHRSRSNNTHLRSRARPQSTATGGTGSTAPSMREPLYQDPGHQSSTSSHIVQSTTTAAPPRYSDRPADRARRNAYLRNMHPSDVQAMYEETLRHASLYTPPWGQKKGLDIPQEDRPEPKETEELTLNMECKVCFEQLVDTVLLPCGHAILCRWCADQQFTSYKGHLKNKTSCPMCRKPVREMVRSFF